MPPPSWASPKQEKFLLSHKSEFLKAQLQALTPPFFEKFNHAWFQKFPERDALFPGIVDELTEEQKTSLGKAVERRKKQIKNYLRNHTHTKGRAVLSVTKTPLLRAGIESGEYVTAGEKLMGVRKLTAAALERAGPSMKAEVMSQKMAASKRKSKNVTDTEEAVPRTNAEYAQAQADFPIVAGQWCEAMEMLTGCSFSIFMGGPDPELDGEINVVSYHTGTSESGTTFARATTEFDKRFTKPFSDFLETVYPSNLRKLRAIGAPNTSTTQLDDSSLLTMPAASASNDPLPTPAAPASQTLDGSESVTPPAPPNLPHSTWVPHTPLIMPPAPLNLPRSPWVPRILYMDSSVIFGPDDMDMDVIREDAQGFTGQTLGDVAKSLTSSATPDITYNWASGIGPIPPYTYPSTSELGSIPALSTALDSPIRSFADEMLGKSATHTTPPRLRYSLEPATFIFDAPPPTLPSSLALAPPPPDLLNATAPTLNGAAKSKPKPRPRVAGSDGTVLPNRYDDVFDKSGHNDIPITTPPAPPAPSTFAKKRKQAIVEPVNEEMNGEPANNRRRSARTSIPSSRQDEANKIGETVHRKRSGW
ncbi:hypothetical protein BJ138DRAFT_1105702 [Hygrophoropsis aurantiaca]|uniref:Uncharacterized protein n=1 Tax=Hygrophoropsis aurantiaca TaxID=72124 RepID=A0ACB7ZYH0_9AGAM|nr:hypothetical protein BJ138DRAFT_1105702 [Hygrophoropsis aurantiaca]